MKHKVSVSIDQKIYEKAHKLGLNVSQVCENSLTTLINAIEATNNKRPLLPAVFSGEKREAGPMGFEPMTFSLEGARGAEYWNRFRVYVEGKVKSRTWRSTVFNYAQQYSECLFKRDLARIQELPAGKRPNVLKALSALAKFDGCSEDFKKLRKNYGLTWMGRSKDDVFIDRLTSTEDPDAIWSWIRQVKHTRPELADLLDLMAVTGLRFIEGVSSCNLIAELSRSGKLELDREGRNYRGGYYNRDLESLEHFWFGDVFLRPTKKAFVSFAPRDLVTRISRGEELNAENVQQVVRRSKLPCRFSDIREAHGTFMVKYLKEPEINFLHGRVTSSVFMANYFNPSLIADLQNRALQGVAEIQEKVRV